MIENSQNSVDIHTSSASSQQECSVITSSEENLYRLLLPRVLTEQELTTHGYPRPCGQPNKAEITELYPTYGDTRRCHRCQMSFEVSSDGVYQTAETCRFHCGRWKPVSSGHFKKMFDCCGKGHKSLGCKKAKQHVYKNEISGVYEGYMETMPLNEENYKFNVLSFDCEMVYTRFGLSFARLTVVNYKLETVYDTMVKPSAEIIDYNTHMSGLRAQDFIGVTTTLHDVHEWFKKNVNADTILIGHSLNYDLKAVKIVHNKVVDTAMLFSDSPGKMPGLKLLAEKQLGKVIQVTGKGHDSTEDAQCCMQLVQKKVNWKE